MSHRLTLIFDYDGPVHGEWSMLSAEVNGHPVTILPNAVGHAIGFEVHRIGGENVVTYDG